MSGLTITQTEDPRISRKIREKRPDGKTVEVILPPVGHGDMWGA